MCTQSGGWGAALVCNSEPQFEVCATDFSGLRTMCRRSNLIKEPHLDKNEEIKGTGSKWKTQVLMGYNLQWYALAFSWCNEWLTSLGTARYFSHYLTGWTWNGDEQLSSVLYCVGKEERFKNKQTKGKKSTHNLAEGTLLFGVTSFHISVEYRKVPS